MSYSEGWGDKIEDPDYYARLGIHGPYEYTDYMPSLEAGTLLLESSTLKEFTRFIRSDNCTGLNHLPFVPTCCSLYPVERLLGEVWRHHRVRAGCKVPLPQSYGRRARTHLYGVPR